jgi:hypothetical protein
MLNMSVSLEGEMRKWEYCELRKSPSLHWIAWFDVSGSRIEQLWRFDKKHKPVAETRLNFQKDWFYLEGRAGN